MFGKDHLLFKKQNFQVFEINNDKAIRIFKIPLSKTE